MAPAPGVGAGLPGPRGTPSSSWAERGDRGLWWRQGAGAQPLLGRGFQ